VLIFYKLEPYSQRYLLNANPNLTAIVSGNPNPTNRTNPTTKYRCE